MSSSLFFSTTATLHSPSFNEPELILPSNPSLRAGTDGDRLDFEPIRESAKLEEEARELDVGASRARPFDSML